MPEGKCREKQKTVFAAAISEKGQVRAMHLRSDCAEFPAAVKGTHAFISHFPQWPLFS